MNMSVMNYHSKNAETKIASFSVGGPGKDSLLRVFELAHKGRA